MPTNTSRILINATPARVWAAVTEPALVKQWQFGSDLITSWEPGTPIRFTTPWQGQVFEQWGTVQEYRPEQALAYTLFAPRPGLEDRPEHYFLMRYVLTPQGKGTLLEFIKEDNRPGAVPEPEEEGENPVLQALKAVAEAGK